MPNFLISLVPLGLRVEADRGARLDALLGPHGIEFPCGGAGTCRGCRVRVLEGAVAVTSEMREVFTPEELAAGWRVACRAHVEGPLTLEVAQWTAPVLTDEARCAVEPQEGLGIAIDLGTTTLVAQLVDLRTGEIAAVETGLNPQAVHGADVMSRIQFALEGGTVRLALLIRETLGKLILALPERERVHTVLISGNTVMHHLFCGLDVEPLAHVPFETPGTGERVLRAKELGWDLPAETPVRFLPCPGSFVGSDILSGILATGMAESAELAALIDLGTNGEIVVGNAERLLCASTAAGPAFEAGRIRMGMRAAEGAISHVEWRDGGFECRVLGGGSARGICGSGLVDAAAAALDAGAILPNGRLANGARELALASPVVLVQSDIRELQLAKAAVAAGLKILLEEWGAAPGDLRAIHLAGAFGNYIDLASAQRIGLLDAAGARVVPAGNTALRGTRMALLAPSRREDWIRNITARTRHIALAAHPRFEDLYVDSMAF